MKKLRCALIGATGLAGQQFVSALKDHPWFELTGLAASPRNAGKSYFSALKTLTNIVERFGGKTELSNARQDETGEQPTVTQASTQSLGTSHDGDADIERHTSQVRTQAS